MMKKYILILSAALLMSGTGLAYDSDFKEARALQRNGKYEEAIEAFRDFLTQPMGSEGLSAEQIVIYTDGLVQLMNTFQSMGDPETCISTLQEIFEASPILQSQCLRDYYSVLAYALSRTESMKAAEEVMLKALTLPLQSATPERYFRDYAYAAAVFYSNPDYLDKVINWCQEALLQAEKCNNTSGKQWVTAMMGSLYKRSGDIHKAFNLFQDSKKDAQLKGDQLGVLNSLHSLVDLCLYWDIPVYADIYATEAIKIEKGLDVKNPMVSAQTYINKGRALLQLGKTDSISFYSEQARRHCGSLPYNSGMVDVNLLNGMFLTEKGGNSLYSGIQELDSVARLGTNANRTKAYHQLAQTYLELEEDALANTMLDSLYALLSQNGSSAHILHLDFKPILAHYQKTHNHSKREQFIHLLLQEQQVFKTNRINESFVDAIVDFQTAENIRQTRISELKQANKRLTLLTAGIIAALIISTIVAILIRKQRRYKHQIKLADIKIETLIQKLNQSNYEKERQTEEIKEFLKDRDRHQEIKTLTPFILKEAGEVKFRQCFELLYPLFLHRLREKIPSISRREELLSMLILLKQDNKQIAELLAVAPRSVLMLRHRFRQKIGLSAEYSLENFIESLLPETQGSGQ